MPTSSEMVRMRYKGPGVRPADIMVEGKEADALIKGGLWTRSKAKLSLEESAEKAETEAADASLEKEGDN